MRTRVKRPVHLFFYCHDEAALDVALLLRGVAEGRATRVYGLSLLTGERHSLEPDELELIVSVPSDRWVEADGNEAAARDLAERGLLLTDEDDAALAELRRRDEELAASRWNVYAALYHFMSRWQGVDLRAAFAGDGEPLAELPPITRAELEEFVSTYGPPPEAFHALTDPLSVQELPLVRRDGELYEVLTRRMTTRAFDEETPMTLDDLAVVLYYVWGCHGYAVMLPGMPTLKRTSPSGGGLHAIEAYPLVANVAGVAPGLYHYNARDHSLELIAALAAGDARRLATDFVAGQTFLGSAHVLFVMAARFYRSYWKYRHHQKAYASLLMDAAHLSQSLYLVSTELGLGAYVTAAVNTRHIEDRLALDGFSEGVIAVCGCGKRADRRSPFEPTFAPYVPRETPLE